VGLGSCPALEPRELNSTDRRKGAVKRKPRGKYAGGKTRDFVSTGKDHGGPSTKKMTVWVWRLKALGQQSFSEKQKNKKDFICLGNTPQSMGGEISKKKNLGQTTFQGDGHGGEGHPQEF